MISIVVKCGKIVVMNLFVLFISLVCKFLPLDEVVASRAVFVIVSGRAGLNAFGAS